MRKIRCAGKITMSASKEASVEELRAESERAREALAATVGQLRDKVGDTTTELKTLLSPAHIKQEIKDYVREERESLVQSVQRKAKENPLQAAAVGAALMYPALGLLRAIPTPLMLIGAGLFLTTKRGQRSAEEMKAKVDVVVQQGNEKISNFAGSVRSNLQDQVARASDEIGKASEAVTSGVDAIANTARRAIHDAKDGVSNGAAAASPPAAAKGDGASTTDKAAALVKESPKAMASLLTENAYLVAGFGLAVGAIIATSLPASEAENRLFGAGSAKLKAKARQAAAQSMDKAGEFAAETAGSIARAAAREGLDPKGVHDTFDAVADSVRAVADRGLNAAVDGIQQPSQQPPSEMTEMRERNAT
jgi:hypothetical protein